MDVLITRYIGIIGTGILASSKRTELLERYPEWFVDEAESFDDEAGLGRDENGELLEIVCATDNGAVYASEYYEFGIYEALYAMSKELKCGLRINIKDIPIKQETVEICEELSANPYALYSGYSAVIVTPDGEALKIKLEDMGIPVSIVGYTTSDNDKKIINEDEESFLPHIRKDELKNVLGRKEYHERTDTINYRKEQQN